MKIIKFESKIKQNKNEYNNKFDNITNNIYFKQYLEQNKIKYIDATFLFGPTLQVM